MPILEQVSGLKFNQDFFAGYSPERINPGDKEHRLPTIRRSPRAPRRRSRSSSTRSTRAIITAGTHKASSIRVAEAAKVIENTQRDVNIALINELALIFNRLGIDTEEVLDAAGTQVELPAVPARPGRRPLHRRRPVLPDPQGPGDRLPPGDDPGRAAASTTAWALYVAGEVVKLMTSKRIHVEGRARAGAGPDLQGELPGPAQHQGGRHRARAREVRRQGRRLRPLGRCATRPQHEYGIRPIETLAAGHATTR